MTLPQSVYAKFLTPAEPARGYPLWFPEPNNRLPEEYREVGLKIGDVGIVTADGTFDVFFNICLPEDHPLHATYGVPKGFQQILLADHDIESIRLGDPHGRVVATQSVGQKRVTVGKAVETPGRPVAEQGSMGVKFTSSSNEGALLVLPEGADRHDLCGLLRFEREAVRCGKSWYEFAVTKLGRTRISADSLYLITGCHKTSSWSLAAFDQSSSSGSFDALFTANKITNGNISAAYSWQMTSAVPCRIGPEPYNGAPNQTIFIRGFKIAIRESNLLELLQEDVSLSYEPPNTVPLHKVESSSESNETGKQDDLSFGSLLQISPTRIYHPSDLLIKCIMRNESDCEVMVIHDNVWGNMYEELPQGRDLPKDNEIMQLIHNKYSIQSSSGVTCPQVHEDASPSSAWSPGMQHRHLQESPEQPKSALQDQEHDRENKLCEQLRASIANLTNQDPSARHEIFTEAANVLTRLHSENTLLKQQLRENLHHFDEPLGNWSSPIQADSAVPKLVDVMDITDGDPMYS